MIDRTMRISDAEWPFALFLGPCFGQVRNVCHRLLSKRRLVTPNHYWGMGWAALWLVCLLPPLLWLYLT